MAYEEWIREIPPEEQLQEIARILAKAVLRKHRHPELIPGAHQETPRGADVATARTRLREGYRLDQFDDDADIDPWRRSKRGAFCRKHCTSIETVSSQDLDAAICQPHLSFDQIDLRDAFSYAMSMLCDEDRMIAMHVGTRGGRATVRELGVSRRRIEATMRRIRPVFCRAGFEMRAQP